MISSVILVANSVLKAVYRGSRRGGLSKYGMGELVILPFLSFPLPRMPRKIPTRLC